MFFFFKQKTAYEMRISDGSSDVCSSDLLLGDNRIRIEGGRWPFAGGELVLHPATLDFNAVEPRHLSFDLIGVDAAVFLQQFGFENINATGTRSEERRVGKEGVRTCRSRWWPYH